MNAEKAREFFSAHYEDSLDAGLRQSFETRLRADEALRAEYRSFVSAMESLATLRDEEIEIPQYLSSRIATRLEAVQEKRSKSFFNLAFLRPIAFGGVAVLALTGAFLALRAEPGTGAAMGGVVPVTSSAPVAPFEVAQTEGRVLLKNKGGDHALTVEIAGLTRKVRLAEGASPAELTNAQSAPATFHVRQDGAAVETVVVVPGEAVTETLKGSGTLLEMANAAAAVYHVPVALTVDDATQRVAWNFRAGVAPQAAVSASLRDVQATADLSGSGVLTIQSH